MPVPAQTQSGSPGRSRTGIPRLGRARSDPLSYRAVAKWRMGEELNLCTLARGSRIATGHISALSPIRGARRPNRTDFSRSSDERITRYASPGKNWWNGQDSNLRVSSEENGFTARRHRRSATVPQEMVASARWVSCIPRLKRPVLCPFELRGEMAPEWRIELPSSG